MNLNPESNREKERKGNKERNERKEGKREKGEKGGGRRKKGRKSNLIREKEKHRRERVIASGSEVPEEEKGYDNEMKQTHQHPGRPFPTCW